MSGPAASSLAFALAAAGAVVVLLAGSLRGIRHFRCLAMAAAGSLRRLVRNAATSRALTVRPAAGMSTADAENALAGAAIGAGGAAGGNAAGPRRLVISMTSAKMTVP